MENQVAVVTGGARGIGAGIVRRFVDEGARVVVSDLLNEKGQALQEELGKNLLRGPFLGIKYGVPRMQSGGTIINIASVAGLTGGYGPHAYSAAKFGVVGLTKSVALELAERGIRVNAICPGGIATAIFAPVAGEISAELIERAPDIVEPWLAGNLPLGRAGFPADIASAALWLASSESSFVTGHALVVDGGLMSGRRWSQTRLYYDELRERFRTALGQTTVTS